MLRQWGQQATTSLRSWAFPTAECEAKEKEDASVKGMLDPDNLERAAKAVRDIDKSPNAKQVWSRSRHPRIAVTARRRLS